MLVDLTEAEARLIMARIPEEGALNRKLRMHLVAFDRGQDVEKTIRENYVDQTARRQPDRAG